MARDYSILGNLRFHNTCRKVKNSMVWEIFKEKIPGGLVNFSRLFTLDIALSYIYDGFPIIYPGIWRDIKRFTTVKNVPFYITAIFSAIIANFVRISFKGISIENSIIEAYIKYNSKRLHRWYTPEHPGFKTKNISFHTREQNKYVPGKKWEIPSVEVFKTFSTLIDNAATVDELYDAIDILPSNIKTMIRDLVTFKISEIMKPVRIYDKTWCE